MIVDLVNQTPTIDGIILIDCWEPKNGQEKQNNDFYVRLLAKAINYDLKSVINAAYNVELTTQDPSIQNTFQHYCWGQGENHTNNSEIILNLIKNCAARNKTSTLISESLLKNYPSVMLLEYNDFVFHWKYNLESKVNNWLVVGQSWNICLHDRPLGLSQMFFDRAHDTLNFYVLPELIRDENNETVTRNHFVQDWLPWQEIPGFGYKLVTKAKKHWTASVDFYREFVSDGKIKIKVHCAESVIDFVPNSDDTFEIEIVREAQDWTFSYSKFSGEYNETSCQQTNQLRVWVFDINEPLDLRKLLSYTTPLASAYHTENKKVLLFHTGYIGSIETIENFVK